VVLDEHNVEYRIPQRLGEAPDASPPMRSFARREWPRLRDFERDACRRADRVLAVSAEDAAALTALDPAALRERVVPVPIGVDLEHWEAVTPEADADEILSIGTMYWPPNVDALLYFCAEVLPLVRARLPRVRLNIVGSRPTAAVRALGAADPLVTVTGWVDDVRAYARRGGVFVAPLRSGSGMRVKILNAMAMGLPVVSTTVGAEGIAVTQGEDILLADTPSAFAAAVVELLTDRARAARMGNAGRRLMERHYGWEAVGRQLLEAYDPLLPAAAQREGARR
jgi:glycosyltransferase involved in cell wall biosynthesis